MKYMLDTNICIYILNKKPEAYIKKLEKIDQGNHIIAISSIVLSELQYGVANSIHKEQNQINLDNLLSKLEVIDYSASCALFYGQIRSALKKDGVNIGGNDLLIASHAVCENAILVTNNESEFNRIKELKLENWKH